jgi:hypothetical protein
MKTLYESILDNEDVLIKDIKKHSNNPFRTLKYHFDQLYKTKSPVSQWLSKWHKVVDEEMKKIKLPKGVFYNTTGDYIRFLSNAGNLLFEIRFRDLESYTKKDACCVMIDSTRDRSKSLSDDERKMVRDFCKQYDFKLTNPNHVYCMWLYLEK